MTRISYGKYGLLILFFVLVGPGTVAGAGSAGPLLAYASFFNGSVSAAATDSLGNVYITGSTGGGIPTTPGSYHPGFAGTLSQTYADGQIAGGTASLVYPPQVNFGSLNYGAPQGQIVYAGQAPDLVAGAVQVNFTVSMDAPTGASVPIYLDVSRLPTPIRRLP